MKTLNGIVSILIVVSGMTILSGCSSSPSASSAAIPDVSIERQDSPKLDIVWVNLEPIADPAVLSGAIRQTGASPSWKTGHVDVEIRKPDGGVVYEGRSENLSVPRHSVGKGSRHTPFRIPLKVTPDQMDPANTITLKACNDRQCSIHPI